MAFHNNEIDNFLSIIKDKKGWTIMFFLGLNVASISNIKVLIHLV